MRFIFALLVFFFCFQAFADENAERLKEIRLKIENEEATLKSLHQEREKLTQELNVVKSELAELVKSSNTEQQEIKRIERELKALELSKIETERSFRIESELLEGRIVELYKVQKRRQGVQFILAASSTQDLLRRSHILNILAERGDETLKKLALLKQQLLEEATRFSNLRDERVARVDELRKLKLAVEKKRKEAQVFVSKAEAREKEQNLSLARLREEMKRVEKALSSVMGGEETQNSFTGPGLAAQKNKLVLPAAWKILQGFGKSQHEDFADAVVVKGLEIEAPLGSMVKPLYPGKVVLAQALPGFGNVVIVDHGERYYTLYGRLASTVASVGQLLQKGDSIGIVGEPDFRGRNCYFELRHEGKAIDPKAFLAR